MASNRWIPLHRECKDWTPTQEGMTDFVRRMRDLPYCAKQGCKKECGGCSANQMNGYGDNSTPSIRFTKGYTCPL